MISYVTWSSWLQKRSVIHHHPPDPWPFKRIQKPQQLDLLGSEFRIHGFNGLVEGKILTANPWVFSITYRSFRLTFSHHPILWIYEHHTSMFKCLNLLVKYLIYAWRRGGITFEGEMMNNVGWYPTVVLGGHHCHPISQNSSTLGTLDG